MSILYLIIKLTTSASSSILWQILNDTLCLSCCRGSTENLNKVWKIWKKMVVSNIKKYLSICIIMIYVYFEICLDTFNWSEFLFSSWVCRISRSCLSERMDREYSTVRIADSEIQSTFCCFRKFCRKDGAVRNFFYRTHSQESNLRQKIYVATLR